MNWSHKDVVCCMIFVLQQNPRSQSHDGSGKLQITWENPKELEQYISKLQSAAERLSTENRKLRRWHSDFNDKVIFLSPLPQTFNLTPCSDLTVQRD